ncbi:hypothetical protein B0H66DRAFT_555383 [Apodospora peruviana]|uniref:Uncharacterized protein n=1 Tax=Apodospora peruviana TaxID=516989 RepID=A0AAE0ID22_9PEZI|nr:hypothetical protein B0H66DRAFT_555383 [Apodospora peruviana]
MSSSSGASTGDVTLGMAAVPVTTTLFSCCWPACTFAGVGTGVGAGVATSLVFAFVLPSCCCPTEALRLRPSSVPSSQSPSFFRSPFLWLSVLPFLGKEGGIFWLSSPPSFWVVSSWTRKCLLPSNPPSPCGANLKSTSPLALKLSWPWRLPRTLISSCRSGAPWGGVGRASDRLAAPKKRARYAVRVLICILTDYLDGCRCEIVGLMLFAVVIVDNAIVLLKECVSCTLDVEN